jgi:crotonobetainyl-CoA:carnitine CoA-transferase CaiB-like acyl-CoA transferase
MKNTPPLSLAGFRVIDYSHLPAGPHISRYVFVENYRPGALSKLGLGYEGLSRRNEKLVYCSVSVSVSVSVAVSAYGHTRPDAHRAGFGLLAEAESGAMSLIGAPGEPPPLFRMPIADRYAGLHGVSAICAALLGSVKSGRDLPQSTVFGAAQVAQLQRDRVLYASTA